MRRHFHLRHWKGRRAHSSTISMAIAHYSSIHNHGAYGNSGKIALQYRSIQKPNPNGKVWDSVSFNLAIVECAKNGLLAQARKFFDQMPSPNVISCTSIIAAYAKYGHTSDALHLFHQMITGAHPKPNKITLITILDVVKGEADLKHGCMVHASATAFEYDADAVVEIAFVKMYGNCRHLDIAKRVFDRIPTRNVITWTAMIAVYARNGRGETALSLFQAMEEDEGEGTRPNNVTLSSVLDACASVRDLRTGKRIHSSLVKAGYEADIVVATALVKMYGYCWCLEPARAVFDKMPRRDLLSWTTMIATYGRNGNPSEAMKVFNKMAIHNVISWTAIITAHAQNGQVKEALELFRQMDLKGIKPNKITFISVIDACMSLAALEQGKLIHAALVCSHSDRYVAVDNALIAMYGKCGSPEVAMSVFEKMPRRDLVSWNSMIAVYGQNGRATKALALSRQMKLEGVKPDWITFVSILSSCSHAGLLREGLDCFGSMHKDYGVMPVAEHYVCVIDVLGRCGRLDEAEDIINVLPFEPPFEPRAGAWRCFLGACRTHRDAERGQHAANHLIDLDPTSVAPYVLLSSIYATLGWWEDVANLHKKAICGEGLKKQQGRSCIEVKNTVHEFYDGDTSHPQTKEIHAELNRLSVEMEKEGYVPDTRALLGHVDLEMKEDMLRPIARRWHLLLG